MKKLLAVLCIGLLSSSLPAAAQSVVPPAPAPHASAAPAPVDLSGRWVFEVPSPAGVTHGEMRLFQAGSGFLGTLTTDQGDEIMPVQSLHLAGDVMVMVVASQHGSVLFSGTIMAGGAAFSGELTYYNGRKFTLTAYKAEIQPAG